MDFQEIKETPIWGLYEKGRSYHRLMGVYTDTDRNYRFYNGKQWEGAKLGGVEPVQINFIKPTVKYKNAVIHNNLYAINFSSLNFENTAFRRTAEKICVMLNAYATRVWEKCGMDTKARAVTKDAAINDEGILFIDFDPETMLPKVEIIKKNDLYFGNENEPEIEKQPYILVKKRISVLEAQELARSFEVPPDQLDMIIGDNDNFEESGEAAKQEIDNLVTVLYKFYKQDGTTHCSVATRLVDFCADRDIGISLYPVIHFLWEEKEGSARGEGEVRNMIPNQIEVNKIEIRRALVGKDQGLPQKVADKGKIQNPEALSRIGSVIYTQGQTVEDVRKVVGTIPPAQMSPDVKSLRDDLIGTTRDLAGAGDIATGQINPETASGRAIIAVQQASESPMTEQKEGFKAFIEAFAKIMLEYLAAYSFDGVKLEDKVTDPMTGEEVTRLVKVPQEALREVQASVKIDVTPKGPFDRYAQEQTIENLLSGGYLTPGRVDELEIYAEMLPDDCVAPKLKILEACRKIKEAGRKISEINAKAQLMRQRAEQFLMGDPEGQAQQMADAAMGLRQRQAVG